MSLQKLAYMFPLVVALGVTGNALAQTSPPKTDDKAPVAGANSFTEGQAKSGIEGAGFTPRVLGRCPPGKFPCYGHDRRGTRIQSRLHPQFAQTR